MHDIKHLTKSHAMVSTDKIIEIFYTIEGFCAKTQQSDGDVCRFEAFGRCRTISALFFCLF